MKTMKTNTLMPLLAAMAVAGQPSLTLAADLGVTYKGIWPDRCHVHMHYKDGDDGSGDRECNIDLSDAENGEAFCNAAGSLGHMGDSDSRIIVELRNTEGGSRDECAAAGGLHIEAVWGETSGTDQDFDVWRWGSGNETTTELLTAFGTGYYESCVIYPIIGEICGEPQWEGFKLGVVSDTLGDYMWKIESRVKKRSESGSSTRDMTGAFTQNTPSICDAYDGDYVALKTWMGRYVSFGREDNLVRAPTESIGPDEIFRVNCNSSDHPYSAQFVSYSTGRTFRADGSDRTLYQESNLNAGLSYFWGAILDGNLWYLQSHANNGLFAAAKSSTDNWQIKLAGDISNWKKFRIEKLSTQRTFVLTATTGEISNADSGSPIYARLRLSNGQVTDWERLDLAINDFEKGHSDDYVLTIDETRFGGVAEVDELHLKTEGNDGWNPVYLRLTDARSRARLIEWKNVSPAFWLDGDCDEITDYCSPQVAIGAPSNALEFDGLDDSVSVPYHAALNPDTFTFEAWAYVTGGNGTYRTVMSNRGNTVEGATLYAGSNNKWQWWLGSGSAWFKVTGSNVVLNRWTHLAGTYDGTTLKLYVDGELQGTQVLTQAKNTSKPMTIGSQTNGNWHFPGKIDEVRVWNAARSQTEIQAWMESALSGSETNLVAYYPFDEHSGTVLYDEAGSHYGALNGAPNWVTGLY